MNRKADPVRRVIALLIDMFLAGIVYEILDLVLFNSLALLVAWALILMRDAPLLPMGSPGKKVMGIKALRTDGKPLCMVTSFKRNLPLVLGYVAHIFFLFAFSLAPHFGRFLAETLASCVFLLILGTEAWKIFTDPAGARLGDILAGTQVVEEY